MYIGIPLQTGYYGGAAPFTPEGSATIHWRADSVTGSAGSYVLTDRSGNGYHATQQTASGTATLGTGINSQAKFTMAAARFNAATTIASRPLTVFTVFKRGSGVATGLFSTTGTNPFNTLWIGFESLDRHAIYMGDGVAAPGAVNTASTDHTAATAYVAIVPEVGGIVGFGGNLQAAVVPARGLGQSITPTLGDSYRTMSGDWYETLVYDWVLSFDEQDAVADYINNRYATTIAKWSDLTLRPTLHLYGQSNCAGRAAMADLGVEYQGAQTNVNIFTGSAFATLNSSGLNNNQLGGSPSNQFAWESIVGKEYIDTYGGQINLIKYGRGSTALANIGTFESWSTNYNWGAGGSTYRAAAVNILRAYQQMQAAGLKPDVKAIQWFQGEQDATNATYAADYQTNFAPFKTAIERLSMVENPQWHLMRIADEGLETYKPEVRAAQAAIAAQYSNVTMVDTDGYAMMDSVHLNGAGQTALGTFLASLL